MKIILLLTYTLFFCECYGQNYFELNGTTTDLFNNQKIYLTIQDQYSNNRYKIEDSVTVKNNHFFFSGTINKTSEKALLQTIGIKGLYYFVVDTGVNEILVQPVKPKTPLFKNKLSNTKVLHSESNRVAREIDSLANYYYQTKGKPTAYNKNIIELSEKSRNELRNKQLKIIKANPENYYSLIHLYSMFGMSQSLLNTEVLETYNVLSSEIRNSELGLELFEKIQNKKSVEIGSIVKSFSANTNNEILFTNSSLTGKPYLLTFGATWCQPCKEKLPLLKQLYQRYRSKSFEIVYINLDEKKEKWKKQITAGKLDWINVSESVKWDESKIAKLFSISTIPFYLLIDKTGKIIYNQFQLKDYESKALEKYIVKTLQ